MHHSINQAARQEIVIVMEQRNKRRQTNRQRDAQYGEQDLSAQHSSHNLAALRGRAAVPRDLAGCRQVKSKFDQDHDKLANGRNERHLPPTNRSQHSREVWDGDQRDDFSAGLHSIERSDILKQSASGQTPWSDLFERSGEHRLMASPCPGRSRKGCPQ